MLPRTREFAVVAIVALLLTVAFTWPMAERFGSSGRLDNGDARFSIWNVSWVAHSLTSGPRDLWNANIFYPQTGTLAYSEANLVAGVIGVPAWLVTRNPYATSNFTIVMAFVLAALAMYSLVRYLTSSVWAAAFAAVSYAFCSYAFAHTAHIQLLMTFGPAFALFRMHRFVDAPGVSNAIWLGVAVCLQGLACGYYGLFGGLAVAMGIVWFGVSSPSLRTRRFVALSALAAFVAIALTAPFFAPYMTLQDAGFARSVEDMRLNSATWRDYLTSALLVYRWMLPILQGWGGWNEVLFPGALVTIFATVAIVFAASRSTRLAAPQRIILFYIVLVAVAAWASLGPDGGLYTLIVRAIPFMGFLRAPARWGLFVTLGLAVLAGVGFATLERIWTGKRRVALIASIAALRLVAASAGPLALDVAPPESRAVAALRNLPSGAVANFPFFSDTRNVHQQTLYMLESIGHWRPIINGYSDYFPPDLAAAMPALAQFPSAEALAVLRERGARYVLVHWDLYTPAEQSRLRVRLGEGQDVLRPMLNDPKVSMYELMTVATAAACLDRSCQPPDVGVDHHRDKPLERHTGLPTELGPGF